MLQLDLKWRPQRSGREYQPVADAVFAVEHDQRKVLGERWVLKSVVHDDHVRAARDRSGSAADPVARHDGWRDSGEQQRFIADVGGPVRRPNAHWAGECAAVTAREE